VQAFGAQRRRQNLKRGQFLQQVRVGGRTGGQEECLARLQHGGWEYFTPATAGVQRWWRNGGAVCRTAVPWAAVEPELHNRERRGHRGGRRDRNKRRRRGRRRLCAEPRGRGPQDSRSQGTGGTQAACCSRHRALFRARCNTGAWRGRKLFAVKVMADGSACDGDARLTRPWRAVRRQKNGIHRGRNSTRPVLQTSCIPFAVDADGTLRA